MAKIFYIYSSQGVTLVKTKLFNNLQLSTLAENQSNHRSATIHHNQEGGKPRLGPGLPVELEAEVLGVPFCIEEVKPANKEIVKG